MVIVKNKVDCLSVGELWSGERNLGYALALNTSDFPFTDYLMLKGRVRTAAVVVVLDHVLLKNDFR